MRVSIKNFKLTHFRYTSKIQFYFVFFYFAVENTHSHPIITTKIRVKYIPFEKIVNIAIDKKKRTNAAFKQFQFPCIISLTHKTYELAHYNRTLNY